MDEQLLAHLRTIEGLQVHENAPLSQYTRFGIGGPADVVVDALSEPAMIAALRLCPDAEVIGEGSNLIVSDAGFRGMILRYRASEISFQGTSVSAAAGAILQDLVDTTIAQGLAGIHTMTGIPGSLGAAVYGNAGAYGRSISQSVSRVRYWDGAAISRKTNAECEFHYRESIFKKNKQWIILSTDLDLEPADAATLRAKADGIRAIRDEKYPPAMRCAGSIFKNLILDELDPAVRAQVPASVVREGKVPAAWFLDEAGVKGMRVGDIQVAVYHANLIYNDGHGTAADLLTVIANCKRQARARFGALELEEEVQYIGFEPAH